VQQIILNMKKYILPIITFCCSLTALAQIPENGLVAYYSFDNGIKDDHTNNYRSLTINNRETGYYLSDEGKIGKALIATIFNNTDCLYRNDSNLQFKTSFTISTWIKLSIAKPSTYGSIVCNRKNQNQPTYNNFALVTYSERLNSTRLQFYVNDSMVQSFEPLDTGWHHVAAIYNAGNAKLFVDGTLVHERNDFPTSIEYGNPDGGTLENMLQIGNVNGINNNSFNNIIDEIALYNRALSTTEIQSLYNATSNELVLLKQQWLKIINGEKNAATQVSAKDGNFIGFIRAGENFVMDIFNNAVNQERYLNQSNITSADNIQISSNGHSLIKNGDNVYYYSGGRGYSDITDGQVTDIALNSTVAYKIGPKRTGIYKYENEAWVAIDESIAASKISVANDGTIAIIGEEGDPSIRNVNDTSFTFNTSIKFNEISIASANLAFATTLDGAIYKYTPSTGWVLFNLLPGMDKIAIANDGNLFGINQGSIYRFEGRTTGIREYNTQLSFTAFPNPANDLITISTQKKTTLVQVYNLMGELVKTVKNTDNIFIGDLNNGIYLLHVTDGSGQTGVQKIVITHSY
jgi:hypothetical protein